MDVILLPLYHLVDTLIYLYIWMLIISVIMSWLLAFGIINTYNQLVSTVSDFLFRITEPALQSIRKILPNLGGIDLSPVVLILGLYFIREVLGRLVIKIVGSGI